MTQDPNTPDARARFGEALVLLARRWRRAIDHELAAEGLSDATWAPLIHLASAGDDIGQGALAARIGVDASTLVRLIDLLEGQRLIERRIDARDRRARRILLTGAGLARVAQIRRALAATEAAMLRDVSDAALSGALAAFARIDAGVDAVLARAGGGNDNGGRP